MKRQDFENKYLDRLVEVVMFDGDVYRGRLYSTNDLMAQTNILDKKNHYFIGNDIRSHGVRFRKSHIRKIRLLSCIMVNKTFRLGKVKNYEN